MTSYRIICTEQRPFGQPHSHAHIVAVGTGLGAGRGLWSDGSLQTNGSFGSF